MIFLEQFSPHCATQPASMAGKLVEGSRATAPPTLRPLRSHLLAGGSIKQIIQLSHLWLEDVLIGPNRGVSYILYIPGRAVTI